jgi:hypothetical protein
MKGSDVILVLAVVAGAYYFMAPAPAAAQAPVAAPPPSPTPAAPLTDRQRAAGFGGGIQEIVGGVTSIIESLL